MVGLADVAKARIQVEVQGATVEVCGISARGLAILIDRFPEIKKMVINREVNADAVKAMAPDVTAAIIAAGVGKPGNAEEEEIAASLSIGDQVNLIENIIRATFPQGAGPFLEQFVRVAGVFNDVPGASGWGRDTKSPEPSKKS